MDIDAAKSLAKTEMPDPPMLGTTQTLGCVFAFESSLTLKKLASHYAEQVRSRGLGHHVDMILLLDRGIITLSAKPRGHDLGTAFIGGGPMDEGVHTAAAATEMGEDSLDAFLRYLLAHLVHFRQQVAHPGFNWSPPHLTGLFLQYIGSFTNETDPQRRAAKLEEYAAEVIEDFKSPHFLGTLE